ncbi:MAG: class B sortase [Lachnospiraceae bacterium]|nr:class B sortase [Lachnospiraceae bacterium]
MTNEAVNLIILAFMILVLGFAFYSIWDTGRIYEDSDAARYETYKPTDEEDSPSFEELCAMNPDVLGWISIYGTGIDYPVVQGETNDDYINTNVEGQFALGGSIFLDAANQRDFSDFNTIIYGHHMEKNEMFGDLDLFEDEAFFNSHEYGSLYYGNRLHGLHMFAMIDADAYDFTLNNAKVSDGGRESFLAYVKKIARFSRDIGVKADDHVVLLSTCASGTDRRYVLMARIEDQVHPDTFANTSDHTVKRQVAGKPSADGMAPRLIAGLSLAAGVLLILYFVVKRGDAGFDWKKKK